MRKTGRREADTAMRDANSRRLAADGAPVLEARGVSKRFGGVVALRNVDFSLAAGEIHALMGENGAGKSTLMKILSGVYTDFDGEAALDGAPARFQSVRGREAAGIGNIQPELHLGPGLNLPDNLFFGRE